MESVQANDINSLHCPVCHKVYSTITYDSYRNHISKCSKETQHQCSICNKYLLNEASLKKHVKQLHTQSKTYKCLLCHKTFASKFTCNEHQKTHIEKEHRKSDRLKCDKCDKTFLWKSSLSRHVQSHFADNSNSYFCECGEGFTQYTRLYAHKKECAQWRKRKSIKKDKHSNVKRLKTSTDVISQKKSETAQHKCQFCDREFNDRNLLDEHVESCDNFDEVFQSFTNNGGIVEVVILPEIEDEHQKYKSTIEISDLAQSPAKQDKEDPTFIVNERVKNSTSSADNMVRERLRRKIRTPKRYLDEDEEYVDRSKQKTVLSYKKQVIPDDAEVEKESEENIATVICISERKQRKKHIDQDDFDKLASLQESLFTNVEFEAKLDSRIENTNISNSVSSTEMNVGSPKRAQFEQSKQKETEESSNTMEELELLVMQTNDHTDNMVVKVTKFTSETKEKSVNSMIHGQEKSLTSSPIVSDLHTLGKDQEYDKMHAVEKEASTAANQISKEKVEDAAQSTHDNTKIGCQMQTTDKNLQKEKVILPQRVNKHKKLPFRKDRLKEKQEKCQEMHDFNKTYKYKCMTNNCGKLFGTITQLTHHKAEAHVEKLARQCLECGRTFSSSNVYKSHLRMRHNQLGAVQFGYKNVELLVKAGSNSLDAASVWNCVMCGCMLNGREEYADHATDCSPLQLRFYCPYCTESCGTFEQIQTHIGAVHPEEQMTVSPSQKYQGLKSTETEPALQVTEGETVCRACHMEFSSSILLKQHMNEKHATYPYCCGVCHLSYGRQSALKRHLLAHKPQLTCSFCGKVFIDKAILEHHINTHTGDRPFQCDVCGSRYCSDKSVKKHMMLQHFDIYKERYQSTRAVQGILSSSNSLRGEAVCHICGLTCQDHLKLQEHLQQHEGHMKCDSCSKSFSSNRALAQHQKSHILDSMKSNKQQTIVEFGNPDQPSRNKLFQDMRIVDQNPHPSGKRLKCSLCGKRFKRTNALNQHIQAMHMTDNDKKCICKICNRGFYRKALLISHMRVHTNHRPYRCRLCNKTYKQLGHIRDHLRFHGKSQYGCKMCGCQFKTKATLGTHVLTHCTIFPFKCPFQKCKQAFRDVPSLLCHCLNETSDDTFLVCNNCKKSFTNKADYTSHMQNHSSDEVFPCTMCGTTFTTYKRLYFHKAEKGHIESCEVNLTQKHFRKIKNNSVNEVNEDVDLDFLLSQYDFIDPNGKVVEKQYSGTDCNVSDEEGEEDNFTKEADDANELILIAEQLTHMAAGTEQLKEFVVPETSVTSLPDLVQIVASTADTTSDHSDLYKTNTVGENLGYPAVIVRSEMQDKQDGLTYDEEFVEEASNEVTMSTFGFVLKENQANHNIDDSSENKDTETLDYTICEEVSSLETFTDATVAVDGMETAGEILCQTDEPNADMIEQVDTADMEQDLSFVSTDITPTVKVVDQLGNELIVCVVNEKGEQEKMPDGQDVIRTVLNTGKYEIEKQYQEISAKPGLLEEIGEINLQSDSLVVTDVYVIKEKDPTNDYSDSRNIVATGSMKKKKAKLTTVSENTDKILGRLDADLTPESNVKVHLNYYRDKSDSDLYPYQCQSCSLRFDCIKNLNHHKKTHLSLAERKYRCSLCPAAFNIPSALDVHMRVHSGEKPYSCSKCDKKFRQRGHLLTHLRGHEGYCPFHCNLCDKKFVANNLLTKHMKLKHSIKESLSKGTISCDICGQMFSNKKEFRSHQLAHLDGKTRKRLVKKYNASTASMVAVKEKEHAQDMLEEEVEEEPEIVMKDVKRETFICDICGQMFSHLQTLKAHQLRHATGSNCVCTECGKKFANEFLLKKHSKSHQSGVSQCDVCGKQVKYPFSLRRHMKLHDVVKQNKYHCPKCNMGYMLEPSFLRHIAGCMEEEIFVQEGNTGL